MFDFLVHGRLLVKSHTSYAIHQVILWLDGWLLFVYNSLLIVLGKIGFDNLVVAC